MGEIIMISTEQKRREKFLVNRITASGKTIDSFCKENGFRKAAFLKKLGGDDEFTLQEIRNLMTALFLTDEEVKSVFFSEQEKDSSFKGKKATCKIIPFKARGKFTLKEARQFSGLSSADVCKRLGIQEKTLEKWESYQTSPTMEHVKRLCLMFCMSMDEISWIG